MDWYPAWPHKPSFAGSIPAPDPHLKLNRPIYARTSAYGHFGRKPDKDGGFSWERLDLVKDLKSALGA